MKKINITLSFDDEKLDALEFSLKKENTTAQQRMDDALKSLYEKTVPEPVREYLESRAPVEVKEKPKRAAKNAAAKTLPAPAKPAAAALPVVPESEVK